MHLGEAWVGERGAAFVGATDGGTIRPLGVGRQKEHIAISTGAKHDRVGGVTLDGACYQVTRDDAAGSAVDYHQVEHLCARKHRDAARVDLTFQGLVSTEEELLAS